MYEKEEEKARMRGEGRKDGDRRRQRDGGVAARYDNIPCANSHGTRPSLFALVRCQTRKQCGPRTKAEESNGAGILNTPEYLPHRSAPSAGTRGWLFDRSLVHVRPRD